MCGRDFQFVDVASSGNDPRAEPRADFDSSKADATTGSRHKKNFATLQIAPMNSANCAVTYPTGKPAAVVKSIASGISPRTAPADQFRCKCATTARESNDALTRAEISDIRRTLDLSPAASMPG